MIHKEITKLQMTNTHINRDQIQEIDNNINNKSILNIINLKTLMNLMSRTTIIITQV